jgi:outer membrane protein OmpA-like peptidoglycan-associated protein
MNLKTKLLLVSLSFTLASCQTYDAYTGERGTSKATSYGIGAAIICGLIGAGESKKNARNAAAGCGVIGASVGAYMDTQEKQLRDELLNTGVQISREGDNIRLVMPDNITFDSARSDLRPSFLEVLNSIIKVLNHYPDTKLKIVGHTDSVGSEAANLSLSERRANRVAEYLISREVQPARITTLGAGEGFPIATNETELGRSLNRRVVLSILPKTE